MKSGTLIHRAAETGVHQLCSMNGIPLVKGDGHLDSLIQPESNIEFRTNSIQVLSKIAQDSTSTPSYSAQGGRGESLISSRVNPIQRRVRKIKGDTDRKALSASAEYDAPANNIS